MIRKAVHIGNTHIEIDDSCCVKTQMEVDAILARIARIAMEEANSPPASECTDLPR